MSVNAALLFETAILMLAAFLAGAVIGLAARYLLARPKPVVAAATAARPAEPAATATPALVTAPAIAPLPVPARPTAAERIAAAAEGKSAAPAMGEVKMPSVSLPGAPVIGRIAPSHVAGETVSGRHIDNPQHVQAASLDQVRAEIEARIGAAEPEEAKTGSGDATSAPVDTAAKEPGPAEPQPALAAEAETAMLAEVTPEEAETPPPVETRIEPEVAGEGLALTDAPEALAVEVQDVFETPDADPVPDVTAEAPLVEPVYERQAEEEELAEPRVAMVEEVAEPSDDEMAAMRAIEGGWNPRPVAARKPADLPEGVSPVEVAEEAVAQSGAAVASAAAAATAALAEFPATRARPAGGFGRPAALPEPREGGKDDLTQIRGINSAIAASLNGLGIYHFDQIADWDEKAVVWIETHFGFKGRVGRERWQDQARELQRGRSPVAQPVRR